MAKILIEESALDSIKRMAQEVQDQRDELLELVIDCLDGLGDGDSAWENDARAAIARCQESTKVF